MLLVLDRWVIYPLLSTSDVIFHPRGANKLLNIVLLLYFFPPFL